MNRCMLSNDFYMSHFVYSAENAYLCLQGNYKSENYVKVH